MLFSILVQGLTMGKLVAHVFTGGLIEEGVSEEN